MQKLWEVQPQGLVLVLHLGQVQLCNCNNLKVAESTNWIDLSFNWLPTIHEQYPYKYRCSIGPPQIRKTEVVFLLSIMQLHNVIVTRD